MDRSSRLVRRLLGLGDGLLMTLDSRHYGSSFNHGFGNGSSGFGDTGYGDGYGIDSDGYGEGDEHGTDFGDGTGDACDAGYSYGDD